MVYKGGFTRRSVAGRCGERDPTRSPSRRPSRLPWLAPPLETLSALPTGTCPSLWPLSCHPVKIINIKNSKCVSKIILFLCNRILPEKRKICTPHTPAILRDMCLDLSLWIQNNVIIIKQLLVPRYLVHGFPSDLMTVWPKMGLVLLGLVQAGLQRSDDTRLVRCRFYHNGKVKVGASRRILLLVYVEYWCKIQKFM